ncbi:MAG: hypothetical protein U5L10_03840 [Candidatus Moranbacteria bacterium]|nr:hypothetical protein [Candidatus Moranbacteria bacterium]
MKRDEKITTLKAIYYAIAIPVVIFIALYFAISYNFEAYNINKFFRFIKTVATYTFFVDLIIFVAIFLLKEKGKFSYAIERVGKYTVGILGISMGLFFISAAFTSVGYTEFAGMLGALLMWIIFINLYLFIAYLIVKKFD